MARILSFLLIPMAEKLTTRFFSSSKFIFRTTFHAGLDEAISWTDRGRDAAGKSAVINFAPLSVRFDKDISAFCTRRQSIV